MGCLLEQGLSARTPSLMGLIIKADLSLPAALVMRALDQLMEWRGVTAVIRCDNGPEYISETVQRWAEGRGIHLDFIQPGQPQQNAFIERYNRTVRYDWLAQHVFYTIDEVQVAPPDGSGRTTTNGPLWLSVASHPP